MRYELLLSYQIYYNRNCWHTIIKNLINPFLKWADRTKNNFQYEIRLSSIQGDHIEFSFTMDKQSLSEVITFENELCSFMASFPSPDSEITYPLTTFFKCYPNNSFQKLDRKFHRYFGSKNGIGQYVSESIVGMLCNEILTIDVLFVFSVYLQLGLIKLKYNDLNLYKSEILSLLSGYTTEDIVRIKIEETTIETIVQIIKEIWQPIWKEDLLWLNGLATSLENSGSILTDSAINNISESINNQLGFLTEQRINTYQILSYALQLC